MDANQDKVEVLKKKKKKKTFKFSGQYFRKSMETDRFENMHPDFILLLS